jgi:hypothetical protein
MELLMFSQNLFPYHILLGNKMNILVSIPNTGYIHKLVSLSTNRLIQDKRHKCHIIYPTHNPYENNLHHIVNEFMAPRIKGDEFDFWLNIDSDNPPMDNPLDLIKYDLDIIGLPTPVWHFIKEKKGERPWYENAYKYIPEKDAYTEWPDKEGLQKVDAVGTGCVLYARRVFENPEMRKAPFQRIWNKDGTVERGNDIAFCERATKHGLKIFAHYDYRCMHFNDLELHEVARAMHGLYKGD